jgi:GR25 family glycosyltransferase involved in LPS biosynthesis
MHSLFKIFDKAFYINLDRRPERRVYIEEQLQKLKIEAERFPGVDPTEKLNFTTVGHRGCVLSHRAIIQKALDNNLGNVLIIEDDCDFTKGFTTNCNLMINDILSLKPKWDLLFFYYIECCGILKTKNISKNLQYIESTAKTHFYGVNKNAFVKVLGLIDTYVDSIDQIYQTNSTDLDVIAPMSDLVIQLPGFSDTMNMFTNTL